MNPEKDDRAGALLGFSTIVQGAATGQIDCVSVDYNGGHMTAHHTSSPASDTSTSPRNETPEPWIGTAEACSHLSVSVPTMRRWIKQKKLKPKRTPTGEYRFRRSELDALLD